MKMSLLSTLAVAVLINTGCNGGGSEISGKTDIGAPKANALNECPNLQGQYKNTQHDFKMTIYENKEGGTYKVMLGDGAQEWLVDGQIHSVPQGQYKAWCEKGTLQIEVTDGSKKGAMKIYFSQPNILVQESTGFGADSREDWQKL